MPTDRPTALKTARNARVSLLRRLAAAFYDTLLVVAILFFATALLLPFNGGRAIAPGSLWYELYLCVWIAAYFLWCWHRGGQTLGMRAWRFRLTGDGDAPVSWRQAWVRLGTSVLSWAALGLGFWWVLVRADRRSWHDLASGTHLEKQR